MANQKLRHYPCKRQARHSLYMKEPFSQMDIEATGSNLTENKLLACTDSAVVEA